MIYLNMQQANLMVKQTKKHKRKVGAIVQGCRYLLALWLTELLSQKLHIVHCDP